MLNVYREGQKVRCSVEFKVDDVLTDPTTITFKVRNQAGAVTTYVYGEGGSIIQKDAVGKYYADVTCTAMGEWYFRFEGTGTCQAVEESSFTVYGVFSS